MRVVEFLKQALSRLYVVYVLVALFFFFLWDNSTIMRNAVSQTISRLTPPINYFKEFVDYKSDFNKSKLDSCIYYHQKVAYFFPYQASEANAMLGFCYYRLGDTKKAIDSYGRSLEQNPAYFWSNYNLGVIFYKNKNYPQAYAYFRNATQQDMVKSMLIISQSKVYSDVINSDRAVALGYNVEQSFRDGNARAYIGIMMALLRAEKYAELLQFAIKNLNEKGEKAGVYYYFAGLAAFNLKAFDKAAILFEKAIAHDDHNADAYLYLGLCLRAGGRDDLGQNFVDKAAQLHAQYGSLMDTYEKFDVQLF